ncbi:MAG: PKD domain-containing protein [Candidatus Thorarchaeota archaeon SMTZ1-45]|nr:MAG: hypothetical protein AM325_15360 [Candidatus Thorarchaeota archaeon SMTZ1-45]
MSNKTQFKTGTKRAIKKPSIKNANLRIGALCLLCLLVLSMTVMSPRIVHSANSTVVSNDGSLWQRKVVILEVGQGTWSIKGTMELDSQGLPHVVFVDLSDNLVYAEIEIDMFGGSDWTIPHTETITTSSSIGAISFKLDSEDRPHIVFVDQNLYVKYAFKDGSSWVIESVDTHDAYWTSLAVDSEGVPHIAYFDGYANRTGGVWTNEIITWPSGGGRCSLTIDSTDVPHITYGGWYANKTTGIWTFSGIVPGTGSWDGSLDLDEEDKPHVSYYQDGDLKYGWTVDGVWTSESVDTEGDVGSISCVTLHAGADVYIVYYDATNNDVKFASKAYGTWYLGKVDDMSNDWLSHDHPFCLARAADRSPHFVYPTNAPHGMDTEFQLTWVFIDSESPVADAGPDRILDVNEVFNLEPGASSDNYAIVSWFYDFGDGNTVTLTTFSGATVSHFYQTDGTYVMLLIVTDVSGQQDMDSAIMTVGTGTSPNPFEGLQPILNMVSLVSAVALILIIAYFINKRR